MSHEEDQLTQEVRSFLDSPSEDANLLPQDLSGDQGSVKSSIAPTQASKANFMLSVALIMKTVIGVGIISLPYTLSKFGYVFGAIVFGIVGVLSQMSSILLINSKNLSGRSNYSTIFHHIYPKKLSKAIGSITILLANVGMCIAQLTILKAAIRQIFTDVIADSQITDQFYTQQWFIILVLALCQLPLTLVTKIQRLRHFAFFGISGISTFIIFLFVHYIIEAANGRGGDFSALQPFPKNWYEVFTVIPNLLLALSFHNNFFPIFKGMRQSNDRRMKFAALAGIIFCALFYLLTGIIGYLLSGDNAEPNYLLSIKYQKTNPIVFFGMNIGFLVCVMFSFPVMYFGGRNNFMALIQLYRSKKSSSEDNDSARTLASDQKRQQRLFFFSCTIGLYILIVLVSILVDNIQMVFNIIGSVCASSIGILFPCFFYFSLVEKKKTIKNMKYYYAKIFFFAFIPYCLFSIISGYL